MVSRRPGLPLLHVLTDRNLSFGRPTTEVAAAALRAGADAIQLRDKAHAPADLVEEARALRTLTKSFGALFVVNDHLDLALASDADGLHLGPADRPLDEARVLWPRPKVLGASARTVERALLMEEAGADYLGVGPVFGTSTKEDAPGAIGLETLSRIAAAVRIPVLGIGGINASNAAAVVRAGGAGVAVISAIVGAPDPEAAALSIRRALDEAASMLLE